MRVSLPSNIDSKLRKIGRRHMKRLWVLLLLWFGSTGLGIMIGLGRPILGIRLNSPILGLCLAGVSYAFAIAGFVYVLRKAKQDWLEMGFVCPLCGGNLYEINYSKFLEKGECHHCKQPIMETLSERCSQ